MKNRKLVRMMSLALAAALSFGTLFAGVSLADEGTAAEPAPIADSESSGKETSSKAEDKKETSAETHEAIAESESSDKETSSKAEDKKDTSAETPEPITESESSDKETTGLDVVMDQVKAKIIQMDQTSTTILRTVHSSNTSVDVVVVADEKADGNSDPIVEVKEDAVVHYNSAQIVHNEGEVAETIGAVLLNDTTGKVGLDSDGGQGGSVSINLGVVTNATTQNPIKYQQILVEASGKSATLDAIDTKEANVVSQVTNDKKTQSNGMEVDNTDGLTNSLVTDEDLNAEEPIVQNTPLYYAEGGSTYVGIGYGRADTENIPETERRTGYEKLAQQATEAADELAQSLLNGEGVCYDSAEALKEEYTQVKLDLAEAEAKLDELMNGGTEPDEEEFNAAMDKYAACKAYVDAAEAWMADSGFSSLLKTAEELTIELEVSGMVIEQWNASEEDNEGYTIRSYDELSSVLGKAPKGKTFKYWKGSDGNKYKAGDTYTNDEAGLRLTAVWKKIQEAAKKTTSSIRVTEDKETKSVTVRGSNQDRFIELSVDDEVISSDYYTLTTDENGRLQVVFTDEFLAGLLAGDHALYLRFTNGSSRSTLSI